MENRLRSSGKCYQTIRTLYQNKYFLVFFGCLQNTLAGGLIYGWTGISNTILITPIDEGGAGLSPSTTMSIFSAASSISCATQFLLGMIQDHYGPRVCSIFSNACVGLGCFVFVFKAAHGHDELEMPMQWTFYLGAMLMGAGGPGVQLSIVHIGNLFPGIENTVMGCILNTITLSFAVFPWFSSMWSGGAEFIYLFRMLGATIWILALVSMFLWPDVPFDNASVEDSHIPVKHPIIEAGGRDDSCFLVRDASATDFSLSLETKALSGSPPLSISISSSLTEVTSCNDGHSDSSDDSQEQQIYEKSEHDYTNMTLKEQFFCGKMIRLSLFFIVTSFWANLYEASMTIELNKEEDRASDEDDWTRDNLIQIFSFIQAGGLVVSPIVGFLLDTVGSSLTSITTCALGILQMLLISIAHGNGNESVMVLSFVVYCFFRSFLYPCFFGPVATIFGFRHFGALSGIVVAISGLAFMLLAVPFTDFAVGTQYSQENEGRWGILHNAQIVCLTILVFVEWKYRDTKGVRPALCNLSICKEDIRDKCGEITSEYGSVCRTESII